MPFLEESPVGILISQIVAGTLFFFARVNIKLATATNFDCCELFLNRNGNTQRHPHGERNKAPLSVAVDDKFDFVQFMSIKCSCFNVKRSLCFCNVPFQLARVQQTRHVTKQVLQGDVLVSFPTMTGTLKLFYRQNN